MVSSIEEEHLVLVVQPNDYIIADKNGVVRLPVNHETEHIDVESTEYIPRESPTKAARTSRNGRPAAEAQKSGEVKYKCTAR